MVDRAGRDTPRFPADLESAVRPVLRASIAAMRPLAAYGSAACGADILCLEQVRECGGEIHLVLPFPPEEFRRTSVDIAAGEWGVRFDNLLEHADSVTVTSDHRASGSVAPFEYVNLVLTGLGRLRAQVLDTRLKGLAVWDRGSGGGERGGSASVVSVWEQRGIPTDHVDLSGLRSRASAPSAECNRTDADPPAPRAATHELKRCSRMQSDTAS
jgi:hypothetical protein